MASPHLPPPAPAFDPPSSEVDLHSQVDDVVEGRNRRHPIVVHGVTLWSRKPEPAAIKSLTAVTGSSAGTELRNDMITVFVQIHLTPESWELLLEKMTDPDSDFETKTLGEVMRRIATLGTARPTGRSSRWHRRRRRTGGRSGRN